MSKVGHVGQVNPKCVCAGPGALSCTALTDIDPGCGFGLCPFFKTVEEQAYQEMACRKRLDWLHPEVKYQSRKEFMVSLENAQEEHLKSKEKKKKRNPMILAIANGNTTGYKDIEAASHGTGIHPEMIRLSLHKGEPIHGIKFKRG